MAAEQRFCPICDEPFADGDAVLRCAGCSVLYHPRCWVREDGCPAPGEHDRTPIALAYTAGLAPLRSEERPRVRSAEGKAAGGEAAATTPAGDFAGEAVARRSAPLPSPEPSPGASRPFPPSVPYAPTRAPRRLPGDLALYRRTRWLRFWYIPAAAGVAVAVAFAVIAAADWLFGGGDGPSSAAPPTPTPVATDEGTPVAEPTRPSASPTPTEATSTPAGRFARGSWLVVSGTGDCLNVRDEPSLQGQVIACLPDGTEVQVLGGPRDADGYRWWRLATPRGDGWAVENYLAPRSRAPRRGSAPSRHGVSRGSGGAPSRWRSRRLPRPCARPSRLHGPGPARPCRR